jgi:toxin ParE1/3/4
MAKRPILRAGLSPEAQEDITEILVWSHEHFGASALERYEELIIQALRDLESDPRRPGTRERSDLLPGLRSYHLASSRDRVAGHRVKEPRHFILYRQPSDGILDIVRILHDSRDLGRHVPE